MKKIFVLIGVILLCVIQSAFAANTIYDLNVKRGTDGVVSLELKSDYKAQTEPVFQKDGSVYFDIKNAKLSDRYKTDFESDISLVSQQIGSKVRIYLNADNIKTPEIIFAAKNSGAPFDFNAIAVFSAAIFILYLAQKFYSDTIKVARNKTAIRCPMNTAKTLNRQLYDLNRKRPEIVTNKQNPIKQNVYVDFQYAKDRKNIKIAI